MPSADPLPRDISRLMTEAELIKKARAAAKKARIAEPPLQWREALDAAPWPKSGPPAFEASFRKAYAEALVARGGAEGAAQPGARTWNRKGPSAPTNLARRLVSATQEEFDAHDRYLKSLGLKSWSDWARKLLAAEAAKK